MESTRMADAGDRVGSRGAMKSHANFSHRERGRIW